eukprot:11101213-Ditylum_brightwellii.AAC.2
MYLTATNKQFLDSSQMECKEWALDKLSLSYDHCKLMSLVPKLYTNQKVICRWNQTLSIRRNKDTKEKKIEEEPKFLALLMQQL